MARNEPGGELERQRDSGVVIDLDRLQMHAETLYLHRFVEAVRKARGEHGRYLKLRPGDALAIEAAGDGSVGLLQEVAVAAIQSTFD